MRRRILRAVCLFVFLGAAAATGSSAQVYTVSTCPDVEEISGGWTRAGFGATSGTRGAFDACVSTGEFGLDLGGQRVPDGTTVTWTFRVDSTGPRNTSI